MIESTATPGVMSVRKELPVAPETLVGIHTVFGDGKTCERVLFIWNGRPSVPVLFYDVMDGGYPPIPL